MGAMLSAEPVSSVVMSATLQHDDWVEGSKGSRGQGMEEVVGESVAQVATPACCQSDSLVLPLCFVKVKREGRET